MRVGPTVTDAVGAGVALGGLLGSWVDVVGRLLGCWLAAGLGLPVGVEAAAGPANASSGARPTAQAPRAIATCRRAAGVGTARRLCGGRRPTG